MPNRYVEIESVDIDTLDSLQACCVGHLSELHYQVASGTKPIAHFEMFGCQNDLKLIRKHLRLMRKADKILAIPGRLTVKSRITTKSFDEDIGIEVHMYAYQRFMDALDVVNTIEGKSRDTLRGLLFGYGLNQVGGFWSNK